MAKMVILVAYKVGDIPLFGTFPYKYTHWDTLAEFGRIFDSSTHPPSHPMPLYLEILKFASKWY
jgi:hypothetical protein